MDIIRNLYLHKYSQKMFYKAKPSSRRTSVTDSVTATGTTAELRSQQFCIYSIDGQRTVPNGMMLDLPKYEDPPKYEDVIKDPQTYRRDVV
ncbi:unnamed protein product [Diamesa hyperborea]